MAYFFIGYQICQRVKFLDTQYSGLHIHLLGFYIVHLLFYETHWNAAVIFTDYYHLGYYSPQFLVTGKTYDRREIRAGFMNVMVRETKQCGRSYHVLTLLTETWKKWRFYAKFSFHIFSCFRKITNIRCFVLNVRTPRLSF